MTLVNFIMQNFHPGGDQKGCPKLDAYAKQLAHDLERPMAQLVEAFKSQPPRSLCLVGPDCSGCHFFDDDHQQRGLFAYRGNGT